MKITEKVAGDKLQRFGHELDYEDDLSELELDEEEYRAKNERMCEEMRRQYWRNNKLEKVRR